VVLFSNSRNEPALLRAVAFTTDVRLLLNTSAVPSLRLGNVFAYDGNCTSAARCSAGAFPAISFSIIKVMGKVCCSPGRFFRMDRRWKKDGPWYLMGLVRRHFRWQGDTKSAMTTFETVLSTVLAYWIVPVTMFFFWLRYLPRQDFGEPCCMCFS